MKLFNTKNIIKLLAVLFIAITVVSCQRDGSAAEDDLPQEDLTNIILNVKDVAAGTTQTYNYSMGAGGAQAIKLTDGKTYQVEHYNLDVIISVGYRVRSQQGTRFRIWATERLREYLVKGFTMDDARLKNLGGGTYWKELLDRIRDIRSSEKVLYRQVLDLYATSVDYDSKAEASVSFFKTVQNKLHYAAHGQTAAEVIAQRASADKPFMGLLSFAGSRPTKADVGNAKNYLDTNELKRLNTLVSAYFDAAEFRAMNHEPTHMKDWLNHLEQLILAMGGKALEGAGKVSHQQAIAHAEMEYAKFRTLTMEQPSEVEAAYLESVKSVQKKISDKKKQ